MPYETLQQFDKNFFRRALVTWFEKNKRDLPWRKTNDPYAIWVSEVMLQQTKVDTVIPYYEKFMRRYPTVEDLSQADEQEVLKEWEGLGYYSRARNLLQAAKEVTVSYGGKVPNDKKKLAQLRGIGPYTLGAILSIAFDEPEPAVDGNVMRVLSRVLKIEDNISESRVRKRFETIVRELIDKENPSSFNQGLMELGALVCTPTSPSCLFCPVHKVCRAYQLGLETKLPIKLKKKKPRTVSYYVLLLYDEKGQILIEQRPNKGLLANMWQFPMLETSKSIVKPIRELIDKQFKLEAINIKKLGAVEHVFSHKIWKLTVVEADCMKKYSKDRIFVTQKELRKYPFSVAHLKVMEFLRT